MTKLRRKTPAAVAVIVVVAVGVFAAFAEETDWPQYRGPNRDGVSSAQSRGRRKSEYSTASGVPGSGCQSYLQLTTGGNEARIDSTRAPASRPKRVPRSCNKLNST